MMGFGRKKDPRERCDPCCVTVGELRDKEVVSVRDGKRLGYICDLRIDLSCGRITALVLPGDLKYFGFKRERDIVIPWNAICRIVQTCNNALHSSYCLLLIQR